MMKAKWKKYPFVMITYRDHSGDASIVSEKDMEQASILLKIVQGSLGDWNQNESNAVPQ